MAKQTFTSGQTLTAQQVNDLQSNDFNISTSVQTGNYTFVVDDRGTREISNAGTAVTFTVPNSVFTAGDTVNVHNINTGVLTIAAGTGVTLNGADVLTLQQWQGGVIYFTSASSAIFFPTAKESGRTLITSGSFSAVSSFNVDNVFTSTYRNYEIQVHITAQSSASAQIVKTNLRASGTSATGLNYHFARSGYNWATGVVNADTGNGEAYWFWARSNGSGSFEGRSGTSVILYGPQLAAMTTFTGTSVDGAYAAVIGGHHTLTTQYDGIGFSTTIAASTMTGVYRIYGLKD